MEVEVVTIGTLPEAGLTENNSVPKNGLVILFGKGGWRVFMKGILPPTHRVLCPNLCTRIKGF